MDSDDDHDLRDLRNSLEGLGVSFEISEELQALTASAEGSALFALVLAGPVGFLARLGQLQAERVDSAFRSLIARIHGHGRQVIVREKAVEAIIEPDLPDEAYRLLKDVTGESARRVVWDRSEQKWRPL